MTYIRLSHFTPGEWQGTFSNTVDFLVKSITTEGPVDDVTITFHKGSEDLTLTGTLLGILNGNIVMQNQDGVIEIDNISQIEVN